MMTKPTKSNDLEQFERAASDALAIFAGLLAEIAGPTMTLLQFRTALDGAASRRADPIRDRLLRDAYRLVLIKARNENPGHPAVESLYANELGDHPAKH